MLTQLLQKLQFLQFSDLHLSEWKIPHIRDISWDILELKSEPVSLEEMENFVIQIAWEDSLRKVREDLEEVDTAHFFDWLWRCRINVYLDINWLSVAIRMIPEKVPTIESLNLPPICSQLASLPNWLLLITWATGSWKSTTLAAMIDYINKNYKKNIITIEDPIEFVHKNQFWNVSQREVWRHTKTFSTAMKAAMREDPDVILVWEMNNLETIQSAITLAETGHLVLWTLHTNNAPSTISRIIDAFPSAQQGQIKNQLSTSLRAVISQVLISKRDWTWKVAAREIMIVNSWIESLIREWDVKQMHSMIQMWRDEWMVTLINSLLELIKNWEITVEKALEKITRKEDLLKYFDAN